MNHPDSRNIYLMAYPRSGSNWVRYCFEFITKRPACSRESVWDTGAAGEELLFHLHHGDDYNLSTSLDAVYPNILLLRNYKECVYSHMITGGYTGGFSQMNEMVHQHCGDYVDLVTLHDHLSDNKHSLVVYYEDFVTSPKATLEGVVEYIETMREQLQGTLPTQEEMQHNLLDLLDNFAHHRNECLGGYRGAVPGTAHSGHAVSSSPQRSDTKFYSERSKSFDLKKVDTYVYNSIKHELYENYLIRYKEPA